MALFRCKAGRGLFFVMEDKRHKEMLRRMVHGGPQIGAFEGKPPKQKGPPDVSGLAPKNRRKKRQRLKQRMLLENQ